MTDPTHTNDRADFIEKCGEQWCVKSKAGEILGTHKTEGPALAQLRAVEANDVDRSEDEKAEIREKFPRLVNMTPSQMREWGESDFAGQNRKSGDAAASASEALSDVIRLKEKQMGDWTERDYDDAVEAIAFIERMGQGAQGDPLVIEGREGPSARDASLRDWGHDPSRSDAVSLDDALAVIEALADRPPGQIRDRFGQAIRRLVAAPLTAALLTTVTADAVVRWSRVALHLDSEQSAAIARAIEIAGRNDTVEEAAEALRADGFDQYLTPEGFKAEVWAARTGVQRYSDGQSTWGEFRSLADVEASLGSWDLKPFTDDHPPVLVTSSNWSDYAVGTVGQGATMVRGPDGQHYVKVTIFVGDIATLRKIRDGKVELSAGYTVVPVEDRGVDPVSGQRYRYRQTKIRINHLALVDAGRAGPLARIKIDRGAWEVAPTEDHMTDTKIDQLPQDEGQMLISSIVSYLRPEGPEAQAAALETISAMVSNTPEDVVEWLAPLMAPIEMEQPEDIVMPEMEDITIADGLAVKMTADQKAQWETIQQERTDSMDERNDMKTTIDAQASKITDLETKVDQLNADLDQRSRDALIDSAAAICPDLVGAWRKIGDGDKIVESAKPMTLRKSDDGDLVESPIATLQRAIVCDLDPDAADDFAREAEAHADNWSAHVKSEYAKAIRRAAKRSDKTPNPKPRPNRNDELRQAHIGR